MSRAQAVEKPGQPEVEVGSKIKCEYFQYEIIG